jgi:hypothetical protein
MPTQRDLTHANDATQNVILDIKLGNANLGDSTITVDGKNIPDSLGNTAHFKDSFHYNLGLASSLIGKEIEVFSLVAPNPALSDKTLVFTYDLINTTFIIGKSRTLTSTSYTDENDTFDVVIKLL